MSIVEKRVPISLLIAVCWTLCGIAFYLYSMSQEGHDHIPKNLEELPVTRLLDLAESQYWFTLADEGDPEALALGLRLVNTAKSALASKCSEPAQDTQCADDRKRAERLQSDLLTQRDVFYDTLFGLFPVLSLTRGALFLNPLATGNYEAIDDPDVVAVTKATNRLASLLDRTLPDRTSLHIAVSGFDIEGRRRADLEAEVLALLNVRPRFYIHPGSEVETTIRRTLGNEAAKHYSLTGELSSESHDTLTADFAVEDLILIRFVEQQTLDEQTFFIISAQTNPGGPMAGTNGASAMGLVHNTNGIGGVAFLGSVGVHALTMALVAFFAFRHCPPLLPFVPAMGFLLGRFSPYISLYYLLPLQPTPDTLLSISWWWVILLQLTLVIPPLLILRLAMAKIAVARRYLAGWLGIVGLSAGAGVIAWAAWPVLAYFGGIEGFCRLLLVGSLYILYSYLFGRTLDDVDDQYPLGNGFLIAVTLLIIPLGLFAGDGLLILALWIGATALLLFFNSAMVVFHKSAQRDASTSSQRSPDPFSLIGRTSRVRADEMEHIWDRLNKDNPHSGLRWCHLYGTESELCRAMVTDIAERLSKESPGACVSRHVDLTKIVVSTAWEPINALLDFDNMAEQETNRQSTLNQIMGIEHEIMQEGDLLFRACNALERYFDGKSSIIWMIFSLDSAETKPLVNTINTLFQHIAAKPIYQGKELIIISEALTPIATDSSKDDQTSAHKSIDAVTTKQPDNYSFSPQQVPVAALNPQEIRKLLTEMIKGDAFVKKIIDLAPDANGDENSIWKTIVSWLNIMRRDGNFRQSFQRNSLQPTIPSSQLEQLVSSFNHHCEDLSKQVATLDAMERHYLRLALCLGETFNAKVIAMVLRDQLPEFKVLSDYHCLAEKTNWFFLVDNSTPIFRFHRTLYSDMKSVTGLESEGKPSYLLREGQKLIADRMLTLGATDPTCSVHALRLYGEANWCHPLELLEHVKSAFQTSAKSGRYHLAKELLHWAEAKNIAALAAELGEQQPYLRLELLLKSIMANTAYDEKIAREVVAQTDRDYPEGPASIPLDHLAELTFSRDIAREDCTLYAERLIEEGYRRGKLVAKALGHLWLSPESETDEGLADRLGQAISELEQAGDETRKSAVKAMLLNKQASAIKRLALSSSKEHAHQLFEQAADLIHESIANRLQEKNGLDTLGLQMNYQGLGDLYRYWEEKENARGKYTSMELLERAEQAYRRKLEYTSNFERDVFGRALGLCSLGDTLWAMAWVELHDQAPLTAHIQNARSTLLAARKLCLDHAPHIKEYPVPEQAPRWSYNFQCWALIRLSQLPSASDTQNSLFRLLYKSIASACDDKFDSQRTENEGGRFLPTTAPATDPEPVHVDYEFVLPGRTCEDIVTIGELWVDVGGRVGPGVLDHHGGCGESAAQLVSENPERVLQSLKGSTIKLVTHTRPDLDAIAAIWLARRRLNGVPRDDFESTLVDRVSRWDQGYVELCNAPKQCWEIAFYTALKVCPNDRARVDLGVGLLDLTASRASHKENWQTIAVQLLEDAQHRDLETAETNYEEEANCGSVITLDTLTDFSGNSTARLLCLANPTSPSDIIKFLAKRDGYVGSIVSVAQRRIASLQIWRHWIRLDPEFTGTLEGLGKRLDAADTAEKSTLDAAGEVAMKAWYDGRAHHYTIVDSPWITIDGETLIGSLLGPEKIRDIVAGYFTEPACPPE